MRSIALGTRGPRVSIIGFGSWAIGGRDWGRTDDDVSRAALRAALDCGVTFIDTADNYGHGHSETLIGQVLAERGKGQVVVATKAGNDFYHATAADDHGYGPLRPNYERAYLMFAAENSLRRLGLEALDILQLHSPGLDWLERDEPWDALATLKRQGKIRCAGWSVQSFKETEQAHILDRHHELLDVIQVRYNILEREAEAELLPRALRYGVGVIVRIPLLFGLLSGKFSRETRFGPEDHRRMNLSPEKLAGYLERFERLAPLYVRHAPQTAAQVSLRFVLSHPACHVAIPGAKTAQQVGENVAAGELGPLPADDVRAAAV